MSIQRQALTKALTLFDAIGAKYTVDYDGSRYTSGLVIGPVPIAPPAPIKAKRVVRNDFSGTNYVATVRDMAIGDVRVWTVSQFPDIFNGEKDTVPHAWASFCASVSAKAVELFGKGNVEVESDRAKMIYTIMRTA